MKSLFRSKKMEHGIQNGRGTIKAKVILKVGN